jgi:hypothetical protein
MPTVAGVEILAKTLGSILAGKPQVHGAHTVIPILVPMQTEPEWLTLAEAGDRVRIREISEGGSVPNRKVANLGDLPLLLLDGEQLVGVKQNRILNMTVLVAAHTEVTIPVSSVEQGRWGYRARHSAPSASPCTRGVAARSARGAATRPISWASGRVSPRRRRRTMCTAPPGPCVISTPASSRRFPVYAPEVNPAEYVWAQADRALANGAPDDLAALPHSLGTAARRLRRSHDLLWSRIHTSELSWSR